MLLMFLNSLIHTFCLYYSYTHSYLWSQIPMHSPLLKPHCAHAPKYCPQQFGGLCESERSERSLPL